eukprot:gene38863-52493_t
MISAVASGHPSGDRPMTQFRAALVQMRSKRTVGPNIAASKGAAAIVIRSIGTDHGRGPHAGNTNFAPGVTPIPAAALSVADAENLERIVKLGKPVTLHLTLTPKQLGEGPSGNVVGELPGTDPAAGVVLVGGHLDSWDLGTGAEETGGFGGIAYAKAHAGERHALAAESDFGADRVWRFNVNLPDSAKAVGDRLAVALAPLGIVRGTAVAGDGTDVEPTLKTGVAASARHRCRR